VGGTQKLYGRRILEVLDIFFNLSVFIILSIKNKLITSMSFSLSNKVKDFSVPLLPKPSPPFLSQPLNGA